MKSYFFSVALAFLTLLTGYSSYAHENRPIIEGPYTIAYVSKETGLINIMSRDLNGITSNTDTQVKGGYLAWSPDGQKIAFYAKYDNRKTWSIHTMNSDGTDVRRLTDAKNKWDYAPEWSPDGKQILFSREYRDSNKVVHAEIWTMNADGSEQRQISNLRGGSPEVTPDGRLVFTAEFKDKKSEISIADIDGKNVVHLTTNDSEEWHPDVSPDGTQIAFMSNRDGNHEIYVMNIDGSNQKRLTNNNYDDWYPAWSPDGSKIIFFSIIERQKVHYVYIMNKDGSSIKKVMPSNGNVVFQH